MLELEFFQVSDTGLRREHNEDCVGYAGQPDLGWLFALADGVGGHERGEIASRLAVDAVIDGFNKSSGGEPLAGVLSKLLQAANTKVYGAPSNMATTMVACAFRHDRAFVAHAGDSRCYLIRQGRGLALTHDHTLSNEQFRMGLLTATEANTSHILSRALGSDMFLNVDSSEHQIFAGDVFALCSDGLHHSVMGEDMARITRDCKRLEEAAHGLVDLANQRDGSDNISVQLIRILSVERVGMYRGRHYKLP